MSAILTFLLGLVLGNAECWAAAPRPDIVIFLTDDQSQLDATPYGARDLRTPNMQRLADAGFTFTHAFVASPSCAPSRAALLTGLMPARNGAEPNHSKPRAELKKWPAYFQELGYEVVAFGKVSHYRQTADYGFDYFAHDTFHDHAALADAVDFFKKRDSATAKPLCLFVGSNWPHVPWPGQERFDPALLSLPAGSVDTRETREWRARYAAAVAKADAELGLIYDTARAALGTDTLFLFSSDHGAQWPFGKWNLYDAGIRVPLIVVWPGVVRPGTRTEAMVSWVDLLPTLLEAAGGKPPADIDGRSFLPVLRGEKSEHRDRIFTTHSSDGGWNIYPMRSIRTRAWKYILNLHPEFAYTTHIDLANSSEANLVSYATDQEFHSTAHAEPSPTRNRGGYWDSWERAARTDEKAAVVMKRYRQRPAEELYDLSRDPHERHNLASDPQYADRLKKMRAELEAWMREQGDQRKVFHEPRLLSDPASYGPNAPPGNVWPKGRERTRENK